MGLCNIPLSHSCSLRVHYCNRQAHVVCVCVCPGQIFSSCHVLNHADSCCAFSCRDTCEEDTNMGVGGVCVV